MNAPLCGPQDTRFYPVLHTAQTGSTNTDVLAEARRGTDEGFTLIADYQTAGRGRHERDWFAEPENSLLVSVLLRPGFDSMLCIPFLVGLAVSDAVAALIDASSEVGLKWPNDVLISQGEDGHEKKVAGILVESLITGKSGAIAAGVGLNINRPEQWPEGFSTSAIALDQVAEHPPSRQRCLHEVLEAMERWLTMLDRDGPEGILSAYRQRCTTVGRVIEYVNQDGKRISGRVIEILPTGGLRLETDDGPLDILSGDVFHSHTR